MAHLRAAAAASVVRRSSAAAFAASPAVRPAGAPARGGGGGGLLRRPSAAAAVVAATSRRPADLRGLSPAAGPPPSGPAAAPPTTAAAGLAAAGPVNGDEHASVAPPDTAAVAPTMTAASLVPGERLRIKAVLEAGTALLDSTITVKGWVRTVRSQKTFAFLSVNDGSVVTSLQVVVPPECSAFTSVLPSLSTGASVAVTGVVVESPGAGQEVEVQATEVVLLGGCPADGYPLQKKRHSLEFLRGIAHLRGRSNVGGAVARVRSALAVSTHAYFGERGFVYVSTPIITASDCEGAGEMFRAPTVTTGAEGEAAPAAAAAGAVAPTAEDGEAAAAAAEADAEFFGKPAYLTVSGQLSGEAYATALSDIYTFGPTFRAENSNTSRHLSEFWMIEPELAFASLPDAMASAESYIRTVVGSALKTCATDLAYLDKTFQPGLVDTLTAVATTPFARLSYTEAVEILAAADAAQANTKAGKKKAAKGKPAGLFEFPVSWGVDLASEHERYLAEVHVGGPVFVYNYPAGIKAWYMRENREDGGKTVEAMDLLVPGIGELVGGSAREDDLGVCERKIRDGGLELDAYRWYLDLRRFGSVPHAGYGVGFERLVQFVTGMENIRDVIPFPRYPGSAEF
ncbi:hypothetical protein MMPV_002188 [Pyropia vietnamensis]